MRAAAAAVEDAAPRVCVSAARLHTVIAAFAALLRVPSVRRVYRTKQVRESFGERQEKWRSAWMALREELKRRMCSRAENDVRNEGER